MKKFVFVSIAVLFFAINANAQLNITAMKEKPSETICTLQSLNSWLKYDGDYYFVATTSNQFDDMTVFVFGNDAESALATLADMKAFIENKIAFAEVNQAGNKYSFYCKKFLGKTILYMQQEGRAGESFITKEQIEKCIRKIKERENI